MIERKEFKKEIQSLRNEIKSLENIIVALIKTLEEENINIHEKDKSITKFLEKTKTYPVIKDELSTKIKKSEKENKDDEKYDWIEDTI